ncbi:hypothetical protein CKAH01_07675 [Colletotrichum kahawae]|uniref:Haloacid dehalogenase-like hydrolase n=1 Tax=Colletotrichum kahawae TaxID=34407 RepID=A0AAD9Y3G1_COLKA|nr:hypothetical protein CKAH01_07675 [Colletotrichum kahawae]
MTMALKALIFDLGGVLLEWDRHGATALAPTQFLAIMNSPAWYQLDKGELTVKQSCEHFSAMLGIEAAVVEASLQEAQRSLRVVRGFVDTIDALKASNADLKFYIMSNISVVFASGNEGMRKPELSFWRHVLSQIGVRPDQAIMIDDAVENICAARSLGIHGLLVDSKHPNRARKILHNLLEDPGARAQAFMKVHATNHTCVVEGLKDVTIKDNFSQLMIWELTGDSTLVGLRWPAGTPLEDRDCAPGKQISSMNGMSNEVSPDEIKNNVKLGLWNY